MKVKTLALPLSLLIVLIVCFQIPVAMAIFAPPPAPPPATLLWYDPFVNTNDIALSKDGQYVAVASTSGVQFYDRTSGIPKTPQWTYSAGGAFHSVAISADGSCVAAGNGTFNRGFVFFWKNARSLTATPDPAWISVNLGGPIEYRALAISDDGDYVVAGGTGPGLYYWAGAKGILPGSSNVPMTWFDIFPLGVMVEAVDISSDGNYVVAGTGGASPWYVTYWKNARTLGTGHQNPAWASTEPDDTVLDVAVSDDGNYVAAAAAVDTVYYWANARSLSDDPSTTWYGGLGVGFTSIDMSSDGGRVIAGAYVGGLPPTGKVYFWDGARGRSDKPSPPSWTYDTTSTVEDVAINAAGDYMAAANDVVTSYMYFFDNKGNSLWNPPYQLDMPVSSISISSDGGTLAVGTGGGLSGYLFDTGYRTPTKPVGGLAVPADKLALLSPWIAVALAAVALTIFATKRRREL